MCAFQKVRTLNSPRNTQESIIAPKILPSLFTYRYVSLDAEILDQIWILSDR